MGKAGGCWALSEGYVFYNEHRPHRNVGNRPLNLVVPPEKNGDFTIEDIVTEERLGGLLRHYKRKEAA